MMAKRCTPRLRPWVLMTLLFAACAVSACVTPPTEKDPAGSGAGTVGQTADSQASTASGGTAAAVTSEDESESEADGDAAQGDPSQGQTVFLGTCQGCHGPDAKGLPGLGKNLHNNAFVAGKTDDEMLAFLKVGRPASDPLNTTHVDMPPKGGNPALKDEDLLNVVAFVRSLKEE